MFANLLSKPICNFTQVKKRVFSVFEALNKSGFFLFVSVIIFQLTLMFIIIAV